MDIFSLVFRTVFFYIFIVIIYRIMGKREIGQLGIIDLIVSILIAELVAISIENLDSSMMVTIIPLVILVMLEVGFAYLSMKFKKVRFALEGKTSLIIYDGRVNYKEMVKQRYSLDDLLVSLRQKSIKSIEEVEYAFLENNGRLSAFTYENYKRKSTYPMPLVVDGEIQKETLSKLNKTENWLKGELKKHSVSRKNIFYAFSKDKKLFIIRKDNIK